MPSKDICIGGKYKIGKKIGEGSFGELFLATNIQTNEQVAIKKESIRVKHPTLLYEAKVISILQGEHGVPLLHHYSSEGDSNFIVMELLGPTLESLFNYCNRAFTPKTILLIADQLITRIESLHNKFFIHRDIKPENILIGIGDKTSIIFLIDFGLSKRYKNPNTLRHISFVTSKSLIGTARYASVNAHMGFEQSRRDDLEGIGNTLIYLHQGSLPWQGIKGGNIHEKYRKIMQKKISTSIDDLCKNCLPPFAVFMRTCKELRFEEDPNYANLKQLFKDAFVSLKYDEDYEFDWTIISVCF